MLLGVVGSARSRALRRGRVRQPDQFSFSWLFAFTFFFTILVPAAFSGSIVHHATDAEWSVVVRRQMENVAMLMPVMLVFFIPILIFRRQLYEWMTLHRELIPCSTPSEPYLNGILPRPLHFLFRLFRLRDAALSALFSIAGSGWNPAYT